jgi:hypothetical protein
VSFAGWRIGEKTSAYNAPQAGIAQLVEQLICNQKVAGSIPAAGTEFQAHRTFRISPQRREQMKRCLLLFAVAGWFPVMAIGADSAPMSLEQAQGRARFAKEKMDTADQKLRSAESQDKAAFKQVQTTQKRLEEAQRAYDEAKASAELSTQQLRDAQAEATQARVRYEDARQQLKTVYQEMESTRKQAQ